MPGFIGQFERWRVIPFRESCVELLKNLKGDRPSLQLVTVKKEELSIECEYVKRLDASIDTRTAPQQQLIQTYYRLPGCQLACPPG